METDDVIENIIGILNKKLAGISKSPDDAQTAAAGKDPQSSHEREESKYIDKAVTSCAQVGEKSNSNQWQHPLAFKRKSNGEPTESAASLKQAEQKKVIKISLKGGGTKTVRVHPLIDMSGLQGLIKEVFGIKPEQQILKQGFPPKIINEPADGGSLGLKSGDKITVTVKAEPLEVTPQGECSTSAAEIRSTPEKKRELLLRGYHNSKCSTLWEYAMGKPELFYSGGYFYEKFQSDIGFKDGQHCCFPLLENMAFCYNQRFDRVELCLEPVMAHYPIDDDIRHQFKKFTDLTLDRKSPKSASQQVSPAPVPPDSGLRNPEADSHVLEPTSSNPPNLAPGYHTLGEKPTELSESEKLAQRNSLLRMVEKLKSEQSSL